MTTHPTITATRTAADAIEAATRAAYHPMTGPDVGTTVAVLMATSWDLHQLLTLLRRRLHDEVDAGQIRLDAIGQTHWSTPTEAIDAAGRVLGQAIAATGQLSAVLAATNEITSTLGQPWTDDDLTDNGDLDQ